MESEEQMRHSRISKGRVSKPKATKVVQLRLSKKALQTLQSLWSTNEVMLAKSVSGNEENPGMFLCAGPNTSQSGLCLLDPVCPRC